MFTVVDAIIYPRIKMPLIETVLGFLLKAGPLAWNQSACR